MGGLEVVGERPRHGRLGTTAGLPRLLPEPAGCWQRGSVLSFSLLQSFPLTEHFHTQTSFDGEEVQTQRGEESCPGMHSRPEAELRDGVGE